MACSAGCTCGRHNRPKRSRDEVLEYKRRHMKEVRGSNPGYTRNIALKHAYGITLEEYNAVLARQGGVCAICGSDEPGGNGSFPVDHDHACCPGKRSCGKCIRGVLCNRCNVGIAMFGDDPERMKRAIEYVGR